MMQPIISLMLIVVRLSELEDFSLVYLLFFLFALVTVCSSSEGA
jgi:hypothetical protein